MNTIRKIFRRLRHGDIPHGTPIGLGFDGSINRDATVLLVNPRTRVSMSEWTRKHEQRRGEG